MNKVEWYYARDSKQLGPVSAADLKQLATAGDLRPDDLVWREGMTEWALAKNVRGLFEEEPKTADQPSLGGESGVKLVEPVVAPAAESPKPMKVCLVDRWIERCRARCGPSFLEATDRAARRCGSAGLLAASVLAVVFGVVAACKASPLSNVLSGVAVGFVLLVLQYVAGRCCGALKQVKLAEGATISSALVPDCFAVLSKAAGVVALLGSIAASVATSDYSLLVPGVAVFLVLVYLSIVALNHAALGIAISPTCRGGEEALGVLAFLAKAALAIVPAAFGLGVLCGVLVLLVACGQAAFGAGGMIALAGAANADPVWFVASPILGAAALPPVAYLASLLVGLVLDLLRAILNRRSDP